MKNKKALVTGITGQDGSYLAELLLEKGYEVHGIKRRSSLFNTKRIDHIFEDSRIYNKNFFLYHGDLTDSLSISSLLNSIKPDEIYNLGAQSHVQVSFETPEYTLMTDALGTLRILESMKILNLHKTKFYQASTSELYGKVLQKPQNEKTHFNPQSPYAIAKMYAYYIVKNYRDAYGFFASNGILFNHESKRRGETFVTRKITRGITNFLFINNSPIILGNLNAKRDWGHAKDYCEAMIKILQHNKPEDFVIATGQQYSIRDFIKQCFLHYNIDIEFKNKGLKEIGIIKKIKNRNTFKIKEGDVAIRVDKKYFRPTEVDTLLGDSSKARKKLKWKPKISFQELVKEMIENDYKEMVKS